VIKIIETADTGELKKIKTVKPGCWLHVINPSAKEINRLTKKYGVPIEFLTDPLDVDERARIETEDKCTLIILRIPYHDSEGEVPYITVPVGIILLESLIITVCSRKNTVLTSEKEGRIRNLHTAKKTRFVLQVFYKTATEFLRYLKQINAQTNTIENELQKSTRNRELIKLLNIEKCLVFFTTSLRADEIMMERISRSKVLRMYTDDQDILEDVIVEYRQAIEMTNIYSNILSGMMDAFASVISNNLNVVMKLLTLITIIISVPTLIASIYGMNVGLPFQDQQWAFILILAVALLLSGVLALIFRLRKWF